MTTNEPPRSHRGHPAAPVRRRLLQGLFASAAGVALAPALVASGSTLMASRSAGEAPGTAGEEERFDETYRGRRIVGVGYAAGRSRADGASAWHVTVDGRPLHVMRRADGSWMTMVDHYQSYPTPLSAARAAVDELGPSALLRAPDDSVAHSGSSPAEGGQPSGVHP